MDWVIAETAVWVGVVFVGLAFAVQRQWAKAVAAVAFAIPGFTELALGYGSLWPEVFFEGVGLAFAAWIGVKVAFASVEFVQIVSAYAKERAQWRRQGWLEKPNA